MPSVGYNFAILQYHHDYVAGEAMNVGVLVYSEDAKFLRLKARPSGGRLLAAYPNLARTAFTHDVREVERGFLQLEKKLAQKSLFRTSDWLELTPSSKERDGMLERLAAKVLRHDASSLRWGKFGSGITNNPSDILEQLYDRFVMKFEEVKDVTGRVDEQIFEPVKRMLKDVGIYKKFDTHVVTSKIQNVEFPHAIKNGRWHCIQPLSFDLATPEGMERKATLWTGNLFHIRENTDQFSAYILAGKPSSEHLRPAYERALETLRAAPTSPQVVDEDEAVILVDQLVQISRSSSRH